MFRNLKLVNFINILNWVFFLVAKSVLCSNHYCQKLPFGVNSCKSIQRIEFQNMKESRRLLWTVTAKRIGLIQCAERCLQDSRCMTYFYNKDGNTCNGHSVTFGNVTLASSKPGNRYYLMEGASGYIGDSCTSSSDCTTENAECRDRQCLCVAGYSFSPRERTCKSNCSAYGNDFTEVYGYFMNGGNEESILNVSYNVCATSCIQATTFVCRTFEYGWATFNCYLQSITKLTDPSKWYPDIYYGGYAYYQRDCF